MQKKDVLTLILMVLENNSACCRKIYMLKIIFLQISAFQMLNVRKLIHSRDVKIQKNMPNLIIFVCIKIYSH